MMILGIETSCDETSAAVLESGSVGVGSESETPTLEAPEVLIRDAGTWGAGGADPVGIGLRSNVVASQVDLHARFGGVVPELSARAHVERLPVVVSDALRSAGCEFADIDAIAVTYRPGLLSALLCGISYAQGLSMALRRPLYAVDHVKAHASAAFLAAPSSAVVGDAGTWGRRAADPETPALGARPNPEAEALTRPSSETPALGAPEALTRPLTVSDLPAVVLVASGGHTVLLKMTTPLIFELLGTTRDDAVGEAFDKVGQMLGLPFPGGPHVERAAFGGDPAAFKFPVGVIRGVPLDFSFSGLKTAVLYALAKMPARQRKNRMADLAASFQSAAIRALVMRSVAAVRQTGFRTFVLCGGVAANRTLRSAMSAALGETGARFVVPPSSFCGDTAAQVAVAGSHLVAAHSPPATTDLDARTTSEIFDEEFRG